jgi:hypothetical protein
MSRRTERGAQAGLPPRSLFHDHRRLPGSVTRTWVSPCTTLAVILCAAPLAAQQQVQLPARDNPLTERPAMVFNIGAEEGES